MQPLTRSPGANEPVVTHGSAVYHERYRPQFHFTARTGWLNDPNGLVYDRGVYHLFFQHNPRGVDWGNMTWGHATSRDLVHWVQAPNALEPDSLGTMFSGSAVVDGENTSGFGRGKTRPLVAIYTAAGDTSPESKGQPYTQCLAYSLDHGRTWTKYAGNPVLGQIAPGNRDPKVVWYAPGRRWMMALYLEGSDFGLFSSPDLKQWTLLQRITLPGCDECPDFFEMPVYGEPRVRRWVFTAANGRYLVGHFDGQRFSPEEGVQQVEFGPNCYAVQSYSDIPPGDGRRIQIGWMRGGTYRGMPFNQQMTVPCTLTLRRTASGLRLYKQPVREIRRLRGDPVRMAGQAIRPGENPLAGLSGRLFEIDATLHPGDGFDLKVFGANIRYQQGALAVQSHAAPLAIENGWLKLHILVDVTSIEVFANDGAVAFSACFLPDESGLSLNALGDGVRLDSLTAYPLRSAWPLQVDGA